MRPLLITVFVFVFSTFLSGCFWFTTKSEGDTLQQDVKSLQDKMTKMEANLEKDRAHLTDMIEKARRDVGKLDDMLTRATRVLARNSADFGAEMESIKDKMREMSGTFAEFRHELEVSTRKIDDNDKRVRDFALAAGLDLPVDQEQIPNNPDAHLKKVEESVAEGRYGEARAMAFAFLKRHPKHKGADDAQLFIAKSYLAQKRWAKALGALRRFTDLYPKSKHSPEVLYEMAHAFFSLGDCTDARILVEAITSRHAKSPFAEKARNLGRQMKKNKSRCTS